MEQEEKIFGHVPTFRLGSGLKFLVSAYETYLIVFTSKRAVVAKTTPAMISKDALLQKDVVGIPSKAEELSKLSPDEILRADKSNYEILNSEITKIEVRKSRLKKDSIIIFTNKKQYKRGYLTFGGLGLKSKEDAFNNCVSVVRSSMSDKLFII